MELNPEIGDHQIRQTARQINIIKNHRHFRGNRLT